MTVKPSFLHKNRIFIVLVLTAITVFLLWRLYSVQFNDPLERILLDKPISMSAFSLQTGNNKSFTNHQLKGNWTFLFFGYTSCPDVCPTTLSEMVTLNKLLTKTNEQNKTQIVFISVDPDRDTPDHLKNFIAYFDKNFIAATGSIEQLNALTDQIKARHKRLRPEKQEQKQDDEYLVEHSAGIFLFDPNAKLIAKFSAPHYSEDIYKYFNDIISRNKNSQNGHFAKLYLAKLYLAKTISNRNTQ